MPDPRFTPAALRRARKAWGHTQQQAATEMDVHLSTIQMWESGRRKPKGLYRKVVIDYILGGEQRKQSG